MRVNIWESNSKRAQRKKKMTIKAYHVSSCCNEACRAPISGDFRPETEALNTPSNMKTAQYTNSMGEALKYFRNSIA